MAGCNRKFFVCRPEGQVKVTCGCHSVHTGQLELCAICLQADLIEEIKANNAEQAGWMDDPPLLDEDDLPCELDQHDREIDEHEAVHGSLDDETYALYMTSGRMLDF